MVDDDGSDGMRSSGGDNTAGGRRSRVPGMVMAFIDQGVVSGTNFIFLIATARALGAHEFGAFSLAFAVVLFVASVSHAVVVLPMSILLPERESSPQPYLRRIESLNHWLIPGLLLFGAIGAVVLGRWELAMATALASALRCVVEIHRRIGYALQDPRRSLTVDIAANAVTAASALALLTGLLSIRHAWEAMAILSISGLGGWVVGRFVHRNSLDAPSTVPLRTIIGDHWAFGRWNLGGALALWCASQLYPFLVAGFLGLREVALLAGSLRLLGITGVIMQGIEAYATPALRRRVVSDDLVGFSRGWLWLSGIAGLAVLPFSVAAITMPEAMLVLLLGNDFAGGGTVLQIIAVSQVLSVACRLFQIGLNSLKEPRPGFWGQVVCAAATLIAGPIIVQLAGVEGAAYALVANALINLAVLGSSFRVTLRWHRSIAMEAA